MDVVFNPKCKTLFHRNEKFKINIGQFTDDRFSLIDTWMVSEKLDGCSCILSRRCDLLQWYGRSPSSKFNPKQEKAIESILARVEDLQPEFPNVDIYGEFIGPGINGNRHQLNEYQFYVFDVRINDYWLDWDNVIEVATLMGLSAVPVLGYFTTNEAVDVSKDQRNWNNTPYTEGIVARSDPYLYDNRGNRMMFKLKNRDWA